MARHVVVVLILWLVLSAVGLVLASLDIYPTTGSPEAKDFDDIFTYLMYVAVPVLAFVFVMLGYGMVLWGQSRVPSDDGPPIYGRGWIPKIWVLVTSGLAAVVMINPGLTGLNKLQSIYQGQGWGAAEAPLTVRVTAQRFAFGYELFRGACDEAVQTEILESLGANAQIPIAAGNCELIAAVPPAPAGEYNLLRLPIDEEVKFEIRSVDVLHSFWIPAFRTKIDAVPGRMTFMTVRPNVIGEHDDDIAYRVQCAELCGVNHTIMRTRVEVVPQSDFEIWIESAQGAGQ